jgi:septal ring factor EnvC (AmiA/AmiB activator)
MFSAEKIRLKKENDKLYMEIINLKDEIIDLKNKLNKAEADIVTIKNNSKKIESERNKLRNMVREQTEADLLINALKSVGIIKTEKDQDFHARANQLQQMQQSALGMNTHLGEGLGYFGLGGAAAFGRFI